MSTRWPQPSANILSLASNLYLSCWWPKLESQLSLYLSSASPSPSPSSSRLYMANLEEPNQALPNPKVKMRPKQKSFRFDVFIFSRQIHFRPEKNSTFLSFPFDQVGRFIWRWLIHDLGWITNVTFKSLFDQKKTFYDFVLQTTVAGLIFRS